MDVRWVWRASKGWDGGLAFRFRFAFAAARHPSALMRLLRARRGEPLHEFLLQRPVAACALVWPYQCSRWTPEERTRRIASHFDSVSRLPPPLSFAANEKLLLWDLLDVSPGVRIILDQPRWLVREGQWTLNIFKGDFRVYSVSFSLNADEAFIGGIQGCNVEGALDIYRQLTKDFHGLRPRDLLLDLLRIFTSAIGIRRIQAVADEYRYFRHPYFVGRYNDAMKMNYGEIWSDRGGIRVEETHFELPVQPVRRRIEDIPARKRAMYRRRYEMLDKLRRDLALSLLTARPSN